MHGLELILTLAGGLTAALILGYLTQRSGLSPIVGYLMAGVAVGPYTAGFVANQVIAEQLGQVGVILLLFGVGLQFKIEELLAVRRIAVPGAITASLSVALLAALAARAAGWPWTAAAVFGLSLSVASTVVLIRVLSDRNELHSSAGHLAVAWLVVEDVFTVVVLVLLPVFNAGAPSWSEVAMAVGLTTLKVAVLVVFAVVIGGKVIPRLLDVVAATRSRELFTLTILVLALGIAVGAAVGFDVSMPLGAFVAGLVVGRSDYSVRAAADALPMRDAFAVLFFVSVGMLFDPSVLLTAPALLVTALAAVLIAKPVIVAAFLALMRLPVRTVLTVALAIGQVGEFSFILASLARDLAIVPQDALNVVVAVSIVSITITPLSCRVGRPAERWLSRRGAGHAPNEDVGASSSLDPRERAVVVGYGPTGRTVSRLLRENGVAPTIVELNMETVRALRQEGVSAVYGDARYPATLVAAGLRHADTLIVSAADSGVSEMIRAARDLNPEVHTFARGAYLREVPALRDAGAELVFSDEGEVALAMTEAVLRRLGATADQIDRERARVHEELTSV